MLSNFYLRVGENTKNKAQNFLIVQFMDKYPDIEKNFTKRDKSTVDSLWQELLKKLNSAVPPQNDVIGWRKVN